METLFASALFAGRRFGIAIFMGAVSLMPFIVQASEQIDNLPADCRAGIDYYKKAGIPLTSDSDMSPNTAFVGKIPIKGRGIISSKPAMFICTKAGAVSTSIMGNTTIDRARASDALKVLAPIVLIKGAGLHASKAQEKFFFKTASKLKGDSDWREMNESGYVLRLMTVQADANGNYILMAQGGNAQSTAR
jgi:hypothetical protein